MKCPWCEHDIVPKESFCPNCGNELVNFETLPAETAEAIEVTPDHYPKPRNVSCPYCHTDMHFLGEQELQRSSVISNLLLGEIGELFQGTLRLDMYVCQNCGKAEFFVTNDSLLRLNEYGDLD